MSKLTIRMTLAGCLMCGAFGAAAMADPLDSYAPVTQQRLENPEVGNWLLYRRTYDGHGYSPLHQINADNVKDLSPVWTYSTGQVEGHEAPPMVNDGVMFVTTPGDQVLALNAATGDLIWRYAPKLPEDLFQLHPTNRGVALWQDKLYLAATNSRLIALDAKTGKVDWESKIGDYHRGEYSTLEPLVVNGKVMVGTSGGEFGVRCYIMAFDADTGKQLWKTYTVPGPNDPGGNTWDTDAWKTGGGSVWITGNYDPKRNLAYWGVGNAAPWPGDLHPGDNLYTSSTIALDPDTGEIKGFHQYTRTIRGTGTRSGHPSWSTWTIMARRSMRWCTPRATATCGCCSRPTTASSSSPASRSFTRTLSRASIRRPAARPSTRTTSRWSEK